MCHPCHPCMRTCGWCLELSVLFLVFPSFYFVLLFLFQLYLMSTSAPDEMSVQNPLCDSSLGSVVTSDYVTPLTESKPQGEWDRVAELMMIKFRESGHPVFRATSPLSRVLKKQRRWNIVNTLLCRWRYD